LSPRADGPREDGYSLVALVASVTIMMILMAAATPTWRYIMKNDREEELLYRGGEIADSIVRFQKKNGNAYPTSLEQLVKGKFLRKIYKDPMSHDGKWRLVHQGDVGAPVPAPGTGGASPGASPTPSPSPSASPSPQSALNPGGPGQTLGPLIGVASTSQEKSLRVFNGHTQYNEWVFAAGQPRVVGKAASLGGGSSTPGASPSPANATPRPTNPPSP
jgi:type II secretory pathway pseudopilin PulG